MTRAGRCCAAAFLVLGGTAVACDSNGHPASAGSAARATAIPVASCGNRIEGRRLHFDRAIDIRIGPIIFHDLRDAARISEAEFRRGVVSFKTVTDIRHGPAVTISISPHPTNAVSLAYRGVRGGDGHDATFAPCSPSTPRRSGHGVVGPRTTFNGGFLIRRRTCLPIRVKSHGRAWVRTVPLGRPASSCHRQ